MKYKYVTLYKFNDELRYGLEQSIFELEENKLIKDYKIHLRITDEQFKLIEKSFFTMEDQDENN